MTTRAIVWPRLLAAGVALALTVGAAAEARQAPAAKAGTHAAAPKATAPTPPGFAQLVKSAGEAREAEQWETSVALYAKALKLKPDFVEGYWYQAVGYYKLDMFTECRDQFRHVTRLTPRNGSAFAFLGLCEFGLKDYERSLEHLLQSRILSVQDKDLGGVARYHAAVLMTRAEQYDQALQTLGEFASDNNDNPRVIEAMGIATLRMAMLPSEVPADRREMVLIAGRGSYMMATRMTAAAGKAFEALVARYPDVPNVHYAYAVFLLVEQPEKAIEEFKRELAIQPNHAASLQQIAYEYLRESDAAAALPWARQAVAASPNAYGSHKALGEALLDTGDVPGALVELRTAVKLAPDSPSTHLALAKALQRAGQEDAAGREREEFARLDRLVRTNRAGAQSVGGIDGESRPSTSSPQ